MVARAANQLRKTTSPMPVSLTAGWLLEQGVKAADIILYGESLGSGVAVQLAASQPVGGVILDAPYTSIADVGARIYPYLPVQALILDRYDNLSRIDRINSPLLIVHGDQDTLIPIAMGRELHKRAAEPKQFSPIAGGGHADHHLFGSYDVIHAWIDGAWAALRSKQPKEKVGS